MKTNLFNALHHAKVGPGGYKCTCCGCPAPGKRKEFVRKHKRYVYRLLDRLEKEKP